MRDSPAFLEKRKIGLSLQGTASYTTCGERRSVDIVHRMHKFGLDTKQTGYPMNEIYKVTGDAYASFCEERGRHYDSRSFQDGPRSQSLLLSLLVLKSVIASFFWTVVSDVSVYSNKTTVGLHT